MDILNSDQCNGDVGYFLITVGLSNVSKGVSQVGLQCEHMQAGRETGRRGRHVMHTSPVCAVRGLFFHSRISQ